MFWGNVIFFEKKT